MEDWGFMPEQIPTARFAAGVSLIFGMLSLLSIHFYSRALPKSESLVFDQIREHNESQSGV